MWLKQRQPRSEGRWEAAQTPKGHGKVLGFLGGTGNQSSVSSREATRSEFYFKSISRSLWLLPGHKHKRARVEGGAELGGSNLGWRSGSFVWREVVWIYMYFEDRNWQVTDEDNSRAIIRGAGGGGTWGDEHTIHR